MTTNFLLTDHTYHIFKEILIQTLSILNNLTIALNRYHA